MKKPTLKYDKLKFIANKKSGRFDYGCGRVEIFERFYNADELYYSDEAAWQLESIIEEDSEFIDAYVSLGWKKMLEYNYGEAIMYFTLGYKKGNTLIPKGFTGSIDYSELDNRPFLRAMHGLAVALMNIKAYDRAEKILIKHLQYDVNDRIGVRGLLIECYMYNEEYKKLRKLCESWQEDIMTDTLYARVFALFRLGLYAEAEQALIEAIRILPNVAPELLNTKIPKFSLNRGRISVGSREEGMEYFSRTKVYWSDPALKKFIKNTLMSTIENRT